MSASRVKGEGGPQPHGVLQGQLSSLVVIACDRGGIMTLNRRVYDDIPHNSK